MTEVARLRCGELGRWAAAVFDYVDLIEKSEWLEAHPGSATVLSNDLAALLAAAGVLAGNGSVGDCPALLKGEETGDKGPIARTLIVDDTPEALVRTFRQLAGWPGVSVAAWLFERRRSESKEEALVRAAAAVREFQPDIIVMDQQMPPISGAELIVRLESETDRELGFVGNSAAWPGPLNAVGAVGNLEKGRNLRPFGEALRSWRRRHE